MKYMLLQLIDIFVLLIIVTKALLHEYNLLEILMKYNLLNAAVFKELPKIIKHLYTILSNYEYFNSKSIEIIVNMTVIVLDNAADIILPNGEPVGAGTYACRRSIKDDITCDELRDFIQVVNVVRTKIERDNLDLLQD